jgi:hypothetical protein
MAIKIIPTQFETPNLPKQQITPKMMNKNISLIIKNFIYEK